jgi:integrase
MVSTSDNRAADTKNATYTGGYDNYGIYISRAFMGWNPIPDLTFVAGNFQANIIIGPVRSGGKSESKRPFTLPELRAVLAVADPEWRSLILFGLYTGQRLSDLITLSWHNIDLERNEVRLITSKTSRTMIIPMAPPLRAHIESLPASDDPQAPLHPRAFAILCRTGKASAISNAFSNLLMQAGLRPRPTPESHRSRGIGRSGRRKINALSFYSLRRTATTLLHEAGVPPSVAQALIGHDSEEVHHDYIGIGREALRNAVNRFPRLA